MKLCIACVSKGFRSQCLSHCDTAMPPPSPLNIYSRHLKETYLAIDHQVGFRMLPETAVVGSLPILILNMIDNPQLSKLLRSQSHELSDTSLFHSVLCVAIVPTFPCRSYLTFKVRYICLIERSSRSFLITMPILHCSIARASNSTRLSTHVAEV